MQDRKWIKLRGLAVLALLFAACDGDVLITDPDDGGNVSFVTVYRSQDSGIDESLGLLIESQREWDDVWDEIGQGGPPPDVNFNRDDLVLVSAGTQPNGCYSIEIRDIDRRGGFLNVDADLLEPGSGCLCTQGTVRPVHVVAISQAGRSLDVDIRRVTRDCR